MNKKTKIVLAVVAVAALSGISALVGPPPVAAPKSAEANPPPPPPAVTEAERQWATDVVALRLLRANMHDPNSFSVEQVLRMKDSSLCITYRARNGFGALRVERAVIAPKASAAGISEFAAPKAIALWNRRCGGKPGDDITYIRNAL